PDRGQDGRLAARRLADERTDRPRPELELARSPIATDRDALEWRHYPPSFRVPTASRGTPRDRPTPSAAGSAGSADGARRRRAPRVRTAGGHARPRPATSPPRANGLRDRRQK